VTETRLVPSIDSIAKRYDIHDDIAGATLIASGASAPELLCTFISLFLEATEKGADHWPIYFGNQVLWTRECMRGKRNKLYALH
jgi:hypothetical protein